MKIWAGLMKLSEVWQAVWYKIAKDHIVYCMQNPGFRICSVMVVIRVACPRGGWFEPGRCTFFIWHNLLICWPRSRPFIEMTQNGQKSLAMALIAKFMTFCDVLIYWFKQNVSFASRLCHDGHLQFRKKIFVVLAGRESYNLSAAAPFN